MTPARTARAAVLLLLIATLSGLGHAPATAAPLASTATLAPTANRGSASALAPATVPPAAGGLQTVPSARLLDTRSGIGAPARAVAAGGTITVQVGGVAGVPKAGVAGVVLDLTALSAAKAGYLIGWAHTDARPHSSILNFAPGQTIANEVTLRPGTDGLVSIYNAGTSSVELIADLVGYYTDAADSHGTAPQQGYVGFDPTRILDTRSNGGAVAPGQTRTVAITTGSTQVDSAKSVLVNVAVVTPAKAGYVIGWGSGPRPHTSIINFSPGQDIANEVALPIGPDGKISFFNGGTGPIQLVVDMVGSFWGSDLPQGGYVGLLPARLLDTRTGIGASAHPVPAGGTGVFTAAGAGGVPRTGVSAVLVNVAALSASKPGYLIGWAHSEVRPHTSILGYTPGHDISNEVILPVGSDGKISLFNGGTGPIQLVADVVGYYTGTSVVTPAAWSKPKLVDPFGGGLEAVSCPTTTYCAMLDGYGNFFTWNGQSWSRVPQVAPVANLISLSCPVAGFCLAVGYDGNVVTLTGTSVSAPVLLDSGHHLSKISCAARTFCVAGDDQNQVFTWSGTAWSAPVEVGTAVSGDGITGLSCVSASFCALVDNLGELFTFDGSVWTGGDFGGVHQGTGMSCTSPSYCVAVDESGSATTWNGTSWQTAFSVDDGGNGLNSVSCIGANFCVATDNFQQYVVFDGTQWSTPTTLDLAAGPIGALSCASTSFCMAEDAGTDWTIFDGTRWGDSNVLAPYTGGPIAVSCPTITSCTLADSAAKALSFDGSSWSQPAAIETGFSYPISGLSCWDQGGCAATTHYPVDGNGNLPILQGNQWLQNVDKWDFMGISCASKTFCVAMPAFGTHFEFYDGASWTEHTGPAVNLYLTDISCPTSTFCLAVDQAGNETHYNGSTWSAPVRFDPAASSGHLSVSCASASWCVAADDKGNVFSFNGRSWSGAHSVESRALASVSCASSTFCMVVDHSGNAAALTGTTWSAPQAVVPGHDLVSVSCPTVAVCTAVTSDGYAVRYS